MNSVKLACVCAVVATVTGTALARRPGNPAREAASGPSPALWFGQSAQSGSVATAGLGGGASPPVVRGNSLVLGADASGQYRTEMDVEGVRIPALIDTGATVVALSSGAAARIGFYPAPADFTVQVSTANGISRAAPVDIPELHVGPIVAHHVKALVQQPGALSEGALLGMSFLRGLSSVSVQGNQLVLNQ